MMIKYSTDIAITITGMPKHYKLTPQKQLAKATPLLGTSLKGCKSTIIAELTQNGNVHYHGIVAVDLSLLKGEPAIKHVKNALRDFGFSTVKPVQDYAGWIAYIQKDMYNTSQLIQPVIKDDYDVTGIQYITPDTP